MKVKRIFKYATGEVPPEGAVYLNTVTQVKEKKFNNGDNLGWHDCWYVWHYFLVETKDED